MLRKLMACFFNQATIGLLNLLTFSVFTNIGYKISRLVNLTLTDFKKLVVELTVISCQLTVRNSCFVDTVN